jgi:recombination protein RecR
VRTPPPIERLVTALRGLPGIGEKSATRLAFHLLGKPEPQVRELAEAMLRLKQEIVLCEVCFDLTESSPCTLCSDERREPKILCIVEEPADRASVERTGRFRGRYFVLGGALSPIDGVGPADLRIDLLVERVRADALEEIILATNPTAEGDATAHFIADRLMGSGVRLTRIAYGMPMGGDLEYADHVTVGRALDNRREL